MECTTCGGKAIKVEDYAILDYIHDGNKYKNMRLAGIVRGAFCEACIDKALSNISQPKKVPRFFSNPIFIPVIGILLVAGFVSLIDENTRMASIAFFGAAATLFTARNSYMTANRNAKKKAGAYEEAKRGGFTDVRLQELLPTAKTPNERVILNTEVAKALVQEGKGVGRLLESEACRQPIPHVASGFTREYADVELIQNIFIRLTGAGLEPWIRDYYEKYLSKYPLTRETP